MTSDKIFRVESKIKNARLIKAREDAGYKTTTAAAEAIGVPAPTLCGLETMADRAYRKKDGLPRAVAVKIASFYGMSCAYLWPDELDLVKKRKVSVDLSANEAALMLASDAPRPDDHLIAVDALEALAPIICALPPRDRHVLNARFYEDKTYAEIGESIGRSAMLAKLIEEKALEKIRCQLRGNKNVKDSLVEAMRSGALS